MTTEELIVRLATAARPVRPLPPPARRLWQWTVAAFVATVLGVAFIGVRSDIEAMAREISFVTLAVLTLATAFTAAAEALVLSVPGAARPAERWSPIGVAGIWAAMMLVSLLSGASPIERVLALPLHAACVIQIAAIALLPGWGLFAMLRRAAPLRYHWTGGLAALAALAFAAAGTQFICPIDDPAHLLVGHFVPVALLTLLVAAIAKRVFLRWPRAVTR